MKPKPSRLRVNYVSIAFVLCTPLLARAQSAEPALAPAAPAAGEPPPTLEKLAPVGEKTAPAAEKPAPATSAEVKETTDTKVVWIDEPPEARVPEGDLYERVAASAVGGPVGLFRTLTGDAGRSNSFRVGLHFGVFLQRSFLISGNDTTPSDANARFTGDLTVSYTPWKYIEAYFALFNTSNKNERIDPLRTDPEVILSLGDLAIGVKGRVPVARFFDLALHLGVRFLNGVNVITFQGDSTNFAVDAIGSFDVRHLHAKIPLRFHVNIGYYLDNSLSILPPGQCSLSTGNDPCIRSRVVETFAYNLGTSRVRLALAADAPIAIRSVGFQPLFEYHLDYAVADGDRTVAQALAGEVSDRRLTNRIGQALTLGLRLRPIAGLVLDAGVDVGVTSPGFQYGSVLPEWNVLLGAAYAYDGTVSVRKTKVVTKTILREVSPVEGKIRGVVRDAASKKPLGDVLVKYLNRQVTPQATQEDGTFVSYGLTPGPVSLEVTREDYEPMHVEAQLVGHRETPIEVLLTQRAPADGQLRGKVTDEAGQPIAATVRLLSGQGQGPVIEAENEGAGAYSAKVPAGDYTLEVNAEGFLGKERPVTIAAGQVQTVEISLRKKPTRSHVSLTKTEIAIKGTIHFGTNNAQIQADGEQLLDEVADVLIKNPRLKKVRIEGHTDNRGIAQRNMELSKARARAVMGYLVRQGIDSSRLESEGYGSTQPLVPNLTPANRARNRRVTFRILEAAAQ
jgi:OOP family OmpA-OmpF porin